LESLAAIKASFEQQERELRRALETKCYDSLVAYVKSHASAPDAAEARKTLVQLAVGFEDWKGVLRHGDEFLGANAGAPDEAIVRLARAKALVNLGRFEDAKDAYATLTKGLSANQHQPLWDAWTGYADLLLASGDADAARNAYAAARTAANNPVIDSLADAALAELALIGGPTMPLPKSAVDLDGRAVSLDDYKGKVLLIDFWATWCAPCCAEMPNIIEAYTKYHSKGLEVLGVSLDHPDSSKKLRDFVAQKKMPWRQIYYDSNENEVAKEYEVTGIPHTILLDREGRILRIGARGASLRQTLDKLFALASPGK
jgi:peroxiredoxin